MAVQIRPYVEGGTVSYPKRDLSKEPPFGMWTVLSFAGRSGKTAHWLCRCTCGCERNVKHSSLTCNVSAGCGCVNVEGMRIRFTLHGSSTTPEYRAWNAMTHRCYNAATACFHNYGGRGITVCERWQRFENFYADMGMRPTKDHQLDRIDNNGNYEPGNCRWATRKEQANNKRNNVIGVYKGESRTMAQWAEHAGVQYTALRALVYSGKTIEEAMEHLRT